MFVNNFLYNRLSGRSVSAVWASIRKVNSAALRTYFLLLSSLHTAVRTEAAVKLIAAVFADVKKYI
jgi:hypothetical protein